MKILTISAFVLLTSFFSFCQSGQEKLINQQQRDIENFTGIKVQNAISVTLQQGQATSVTVFTANAEDLNKVITEVNNGVLHIKLSESNRKWRNKKIKVEIVMPTIENLEASGASDIKVEGKILTENLKIKLSGASDLKASIKALKLNADVSGASDLKLSGICGSVVIESSGASSVKSYELNCEEADLKASGASDIRISVQKTLKANASGASSIYYKGKPSLKDLNNSGASSIKNKED